MIGIRELRPNGTDAELVRQALEQARRAEERGPADEALVSELLRALRWAGAIASLLLVGVFLGSWASEQEPELLIRLAAAIALVVGSAVILLANVRAHGVAFVPRREDGPVSPAEEAGAAQSNAEAWANRGNATLFGMEIPAGTSVIAFAEQLGFRHSDGCTNCERGGHPDWCTWVAIEDPDEGRGVEGHANPSSYEGDAASASFRACALDRAVVPRALGQSQQARVGIRGSQHTGDDVGHDGAAGVEPSRPSSGSTNCHEMRRRTLSAVRNNASGGHTCPVLAGEEPGVPRSEASLRTPSAFSDGGCLPDRSPRPSQPRGPNSDVQANAGRQCLLGVTAGETARSNSLEAGGMGRCRRGLDGDAA